MRASSACDNAFQRRVGDKSVTRLRYALLDLVSAWPGRQQVEIGDMLQLSRSSVTLLTDYWEQRGAIERRPDPGDRRSYSVHLTDAGHSILADLRRRVSDQESSFASALSKSERTELARLLSKLGSE